MKILLLFLLFILFSSSDSYSFDGPLQTRNQFPLYLHIDSQYLESAEYDDSISASLSHSSVYINRDSTNWDVLLDMEISDLTLRFKKNINNAIEVGVDFNLLNIHGGIMDGTVNYFHSSLNLLDYGREKSPENEFGYSVVNQGRLLITGEEGGTDIGDIRVALKRRIFSNNIGTLSIRGDLEFPTGSTKTGYGNGNLDAGAGLLHDLQLGDTYKLYTNIGVVFPGDIDSSEIVNTSEYLYGGTALEWAGWQRVSLLGQIFFQTSPLPYMDIIFIDNPAILLILGLRYAGDNNGLEFSFTEDLNATGACDFTFNLTYKYQLYRARGQTSDNRI